MKKYGKQMQMGNQRRSYPNLNAIVKEVHDGLLVMHILQKHGTRIIENQLVLEKKFLCPQHLILNYGRGRHHEKITRIIWCITTGIGSGIGARVKHVTTARMK